MFVSARTRVHLFTLIAISFAYPLATQAATKTGLGEAPPFSWGAYAPGTGVAGITVQDYRNTDGTAGGGVINYNKTVWDNDPDPLEPPIENVGNISFQYLLYRGSTGGAGGATNRVGAALMGGFHLTDLDDLGVNFGFWQIYTDNAAPGGVIDGGGYQGKTNGQIPAYNVDPGWNYAGTEYDYFDIPANTVASGAETVSFETALVCYNATTVHVMADFTWSFTSDGLGGVTGTAPTEQAAASNMMMNLYSPLNPGLMQNIGVGSCHDLVPEPSTLLLILLTIPVLHRRRQQVAA